MQQWLIDNIWLVPLYPLAAFFLIAFTRAFSRGSGLFAAKEISMGLTILATVLGLVHTALGALPWLLSQAPDQVAVIEKNWPWLVAGDFTLSMGYLLDSMSVMMLFVVTFISLWIQVYTHGYMRHDAGYCKFYAYLALFNFSMLGLVLSTNLFQMYIFWELVGVSSYLLIGFWFTKPSAAAASMKAFMMNRVGDFGFLFGILGLLYFSFPFWNSVIAAHPDMALLSFRAFSPDVLLNTATLPVDVANAIALSVPGGSVSLTGATLGLAGAGLFALIAFLIFMGPMAKSAQLPLHTWLPDAMEGPTPISALIHAATMVAAGVYLIGRVYPVFVSSEVAMGIVTLIGTLTAVVAATIALTQYDIKKALAYSTMSQLGFMVAAMGMGAFAAGLFHLFTHAFFKAMLFLCSGSVIHACEDEQDMRQMGGLAQKLPITHLTYLIGCLAISGIALSGFWSKDMILAYAQEWGASYSPAIFWALVITAAMTAFYMFRTYFLTFWGKYRGTAHVHHEDAVMTTPLLILAVPSIGIGVLLAGVLPGWPSFAAYIHPTLEPLWLASAHVHHPHSVLEAFTSPIGMVSMAIGLGGALVAWFLYGTSVGAGIPEKIRTAPIASDAFRLFSNKWYFDNLYQAFVDRVYLAFARGSATFDRSAIDGVVNWTGHSVLGSGYLLRHLQSGKIQTYIAIMFFSVVVLSLLLFYWLL